MDAKWCGIDVLGPVPLAHCLPERLHFFTLATPRRFGELKSENCTLAGETNGSPSSSGMAKTSATDEKQKGVARGRCIVERK